MNVQRQFDAFIEAISLPQGAVRRIESATSVLTEFLLDRLSLGEEDVFLQGSYPNGTAVRPVEGGEYDADMVCVIGGRDQTADEVLDGLEDLLRTDGRFASRLVSKKPCVRLEYAHDDVGEFHVDLVPARVSSSFACPLDAPRRGEGWHGTAPREYTQWCMERGDDFSRTVKAFKRWRDEQQTVRGAVKSIVLQVLVARHMPAAGGDAERFIGTLVSMSQELAGLTAPPPVPNPVLPSENLAARWEPAAFLEFVRELGEAVADSQRAMAATDSVEGTDAWQDIFGDAFPAVQDDAFGIRLGDDSHARGFGAHGWVESLDPRYGVRIAASMARGRRDTRLSRYPDNGPLVFHGRKLRFRALLRGPGDAELWWQVANTGHHARTASGLRGDFFKSRRLGGAPSPDPLETWEDTSYTGAHWIRAILVKSNRVVAVSEKFVVNVYNKGHRFAL